MKFALLPGNSNMRYSQQSGLWILQATVHDAGTITCQATLGNRKFLTQCRTGSQIAELSVIQNIKGSENWPY
jgi:hypothetical protein